MATAARNSTCTLTPAVPDQMIKYFRSITSTADVSKEDLHSTSKAAADQDWDNRLCLSAPVPPTVPFVTTKCSKPNASSVGAAP
ncbi:hypothetical protein NDU88_007546 [Pleurodeles waltl]|uniref:Uncharacterized protein n=1 Tax=Pleurodeles waltl TaxID=8319 RepID=A0AAV7VQ19_PLEWA|nr:hypothetical protein NDU88_007546 [Pleurodeles waltl]